MIDSSHGWEFNLSPLGTTPLSKIPGSFAGPANLSDQRSEGRSNNATPACRIYGKPAALSYD
jgi:hypothetical protein